MKKDILYTIIGGSGFLGSEICKEMIKKNFKFEILDKDINKYFEEYTNKVDINDFDKLHDNLNGDYVIHLAAEHKDNLSDNSAYYQANVSGTKNIIEVCEKKNINNIIFTSSVAVYGLNINKADEFTNPNPSNDYGKSKLIAENLLKDWSRKDHKRNLIIIRPTAIFGLGNRGNIYNLLNQINSNFFAMIGKGQNKKSIAFVSNVASFIVECIDKNVENELINYADYPTLNMNKFVKLSRRHLGKKFLFPTVPYFLGIIIGTVLDIFSYFLPFSFPISRNRVEKFCASSEILSKNAIRKNFIPPYDVKSALKKTINKEFNQ